MRKCMKCGTTYENDCKFCAIDGESLVLVTEETPAPVSDPAQNQQPEQPVAPAPVPDPVQNEQLEQPVAPAPVPDPVQNQQLPEQANQKQDSSAGSYNYGMTVVEKAVVGVLIGIIAIAIVLGILFITGVLGGK